MNPPQKIIVPVVFLHEAPLQVLTVDEAGLRKMLRYDRKAPAAARQASWRFRTEFGISTLPGGVYSIAEIQGAANGTVHKKTATR